MTIAQCSVSFVALGYFRNAPFDIQGRTLDNFFLILFLSINMINMKLRMTCSEAFLLEDNLRMLLKSFLLNCITEVFHSMFITKN